MREDPEKQRTGKGALHLGVLGQSNCGDSHLPAHHQHAACQHSFGLGQKSSHCPVLPALISASVPIPCLQQNGEAPTRPPRSFTTFQGGQPSWMMWLSVSCPPALRVRQRALTFQWASSEDWGVVPVRIH